MGWAGSNSTYGKYGVQYFSNTTGNGTTQLCDLVNNCIAPDLSFRVVANDVNKDQSKLAISTENGASATNPTQMIANGKSNYRLSYDVKDAYANKVVPVVSKENSNLQIKAVDSTMTFENGLHVDQLKNSGGVGVRLVGVANLNPSPKMLDYAEAINDTGIVSMTEGTEAVGGPKANYAISLNSPVPTQGAYPYLSDKSVLSVKKINNTTNRISSAADVPLSMTYPSTVT
jgi:hypothetical protein